MDNDLKKKTNEVKKATTKKAKQTVAKAKTKAASSVSKAKKIKKESLNVLNESTKVVKNTINEVIEDNFNKKQCVHCHKFIDKGLNVCPYCRKSQKDHLGLILAIILGFILTLCICGSYFVSKYTSNKVGMADYKTSCNLISYEDLVRHAKNYKSKNVKVIGKVVSVEGTDVVYGNQMTITINANLFADGTEQLVKVEYLDKTFEKGFITGDTITIYGTYTQLNGNTPLIKGEYIDYN